MSDFPSLFSDDDLTQNESSGQDGSNTEIKFSARKKINQTYVIQPNSITKAIYDMNLGSKRIIMMACSLLLSRDEKGQLTAKKDLTVRFKLEDVMRTLNLSHGSTTKKMLEQGITTIFDQKLRIRTNDGWTKILHWFISTNYSIEKNGIELTFTPEVAQAFIEYLNGYSVISLDVYGNLTGKYSIRMYELCWSYHGFANKDGEWKTPQVSVQEIRTMWQIEDSKYPMMSDFKKRVFDVAKNEINGYQNSQFTVTGIEDIKEGKKITGWIFHCKMNKLQAEKSSPLLSIARTEEEMEEEILHVHHDEVISLFKQKIKNISESNSDLKMRMENEAFEQARTEIYLKYRK